MEGDLMDKAKVFFTDFSTKPGMSLLKKLEILLERSGVLQIVEEGKMAAVKIHFGEYGNLAYIRPNYTRVIVDELKKRGAVPFVTDANTLYKGSRSNAVDHLKTAVVNGYSAEVVGAPVIIADGLRGSDEVKIRIDGDYVKEAKIGSAIALADCVISVAHFKGHEQTGFGGALKNIGMGSASRSGKMEQHSNSKPVIDKQNCVKCRMCEINCPASAISVGDYASIDYEKCIGCGQCIAMCNFGAVIPVWDSSTELLSMKIAEYSKAVLQGKKSFHVNFINNISPNCDCWGMNEPPIAPDIGIAVSLDPVALDQACYDFVKESVGYDPFAKIHSHTDSLVQLEHARKIGIGNREYELVRISCSL